MKERPLISVKEARKLLGKEARELNDEQVMELIALLTDTARQHLKRISVKSTTEEIE